MQCPLCNGSGLIKPPKNILRTSDMTELKRTAARLLKEKGYTYREMMKIFGYKSTRSISELLKETRDE
jgi:hypothetical protein